MMFEENAQSPAVPMIPLAGTGGATAAIPLGPRGVSDERGIRLFAAIFASTLSVHAAVALRLLQAQPPSHVKPFVSQVEIRMFRPPPPPTPVIVPPQEAHPLPPPPPEPLPRALPRRATVPVPARPVEDSIPVDNAAPAGEEAALPAGTAEPVVQAPVAAPPAPPPPPAVVEAKEGANYLKNPRPAYPHVAMREGWQGSVSLRVRVLPSGRPDSIAVQRSSGRSVLDDAAVEAVKRWTFMPATQGGQAIPGWVTVPIEFRLQ